MRALVADISFVVLIAARHQYCEVQPGEVISPFYLRLAWKLNEKKSLIKVDRNVGKFVVLIWFGPVSVGALNATGGLQKMS